MSFCIRILAGKYKGRVIQKGAMEGVRPTSHRIRSAVFNSLTHRFFHAQAMEGVEMALQGARVLDLFCGSGAYGLEALSRGAEAACFVDERLAACAQVEAVLQNFRLPRNQAFVQRRDLQNSLPSLEGRPPCTLIFMDPPYDFSPAAWHELLQRLLDAPFLAPDALLVAETKDAFDAAGLFQKMHEISMLRSTITFLRKEDAS